jgi:hypothetical protein
MRLALWVDDERVMVLSFRVHRRMLVVADGM